MEVLWGDDYPCHWTLLLVVTGETSIAHTGQSLVEKTTKKKKKRGIANSQIGSISLIWEMAAVNRLWHLHDTVIKSLWLRHATSTDELLRVILVNHGRKTEAFISPCHNYEAIPAFGQVMLQNVSELYFNVNITALKHQAKSEFASQLWSTYKCMAHLKKAVLLANPVQWYSSSERMAVCKLPNETSWRWTKASITNEKNRTPAPSVGR